MTSFITQCPNCSTRFRISRSQLRAAHGAVRCGACLEVFNAVHHLLRDELSPAPGQVAATTAAQAETPRPVAATPGAAPTSKADETLWIHDDLDLDSLDLDEELAKLEQQERELSQDLLSLETRSGSTKTARASDAATSEHDESWAEILLNAEQTATSAVPGSDGPVSFTPVTADTPQPPSPLAVSARPLSAAKAQQARSERVEPALSRPDTEPLDQPDDPVIPSVNPNCAASRCSNSTTSRCNWTGRNARSPGDAGSAGAR